MTNPVLPSTVGKKGAYRGPLGDVHPFIVLDEVRHVQSDDPDCIFVFQRLQFDGGREELRLGYYVIGKREGPTKGKWCWGQFAAMGPACDLQGLFRMATEKGWFQPILNGGQSGNMRMITLDKSIAKPLYGPGAISLEEQRRIEDEVIAEIFGRKPGEKLNHDDETGLEEA